MTQITSGLQLTATSSSMPEPTLQTRHRRFFESRQRREARRIRERGDDKDKVEGKVEDKESSESSGDESSTKTQTQTVTSSTQAPATIASTTSQPVSLPPPSSSPPQTFATSTLASVTTSNAVPSSSVVAITKTSAVITPPVPTALPVVQESSSSITSIKTTSTQPTSSAPVTSFQSIISPPVTAPQSSITSQTSTTSQSSVLPVPTPDPTIGTINSSTPPLILEKTSSSTISGGAVAGIVLGIAALIIAAVLAFCLVRRRGRPNYRDSLPPMSVVDANPPSVIARAKRRAESILWGSDATVGTRTEASFPPAIVPASMQPGGRHNKNGVNMLPPPPAYPDPIRNPNRNTATTDLEYFSRPISSRWPGATMQSISGMVPPFKNVKSWVDKGNGGGELEPKGPYTKMI